MSGAAVVFGASGFIGGRLVRALAASGREVLGLSSADCDLLDPAAVGRTLAKAGPRPALFLCAAIGRLREDSWEAMRKNLDMVRNVAAAACEPEAVVFLSSSDVYGRPAPGRVLTEDSAARPDTWYGLSKLTGEGVLALGFAGRCPVASLRLPGVYGPGDNGGSMLGRLADSALARGEMVLTGRGELRRDWVFVEDICRLALRLAASPVHGVFNAATGESPALKEWAGLVAAAVGRETPIRLDDLRDARSFDLVFSNAALLAAVPGFAFTPRPQAVAAYVAWRAGRETA